MSNNIDKLADKLGKTYIGTPKSSAQRAAESAERKEGAKIFAAERESANRRGSWMNTVKHATAAASKKVQKLLTREQKEMKKLMIQDRHNRTTKSAMKSAKRRQGRIKAMTAARAKTRANVKKTKRKTEAERLSDELTDAVKNNTRKIGRTRRETAAIKKAAIVENAEE